MSDLDPDRFTPRDERSSVTLDLHYSVATPVFYALIALIIVLELIVRALTR